MKLTYVGLFDTKVSLEGFSEKKNIKSGETFEVSETDYSKLVKNKYFFDSKNKKEIEQKSNALKEARKKELEKIEKIKLKEEQIKLKSQIDKKNIELNKLKTNFKQNKDNIDISEIQIQNKLKEIDQIKIKKEKFVNNNKIVKKEIEEFEIEIEALKNTLSKLN